MPVGREERGRVRKGRRTLRALVATALIAKAGATFLAAHGAFAAPERAPSGAVGAGAGATQGASGVGAAPGSAAHAPTGGKGTPPSGALASVAGKTPVRASESGRASAEEAQRGANVTALLDAISRRQAELDDRERSASRREEQLKSYERDVTRKLQELEEIEKRLQAREGEATAAADRAAASLAKVYGAMKPADAAPILEQLDEAIVLSILARMKEKEVGQILPLMARERAILLTRSLVSRR